MPKKEDRVTDERFIRVIMRSPTIAAAAAELGLTHQAVSKRLRTYREAGVKGLPEFPGNRTNVDAVQQLVNKHKGK